MRQSSLARFGIGSGAQSKPTETGDLAEPLKPEAKKGETKAAIKKPSTRVSAKAPNASKNEPQPSPKKEPLPATVKVVEEEVKDKNTKSQSRPSKREASPVKE